jgi:hypothetical protein
MLSLQEVMKYNEDDNKSELTELKEKDACCPKDKKMEVEENKK